VILLGEQDGRVSFSVEDDGVGFDSAAVEHGAGLTNVADRVAAIGGTLRVEGRPGHGTLVAGELPA
jgi:two-component system, NarL family, sensor histidine kinase UhpB